MVSTTGTPVAHDVINTIFGTGGALSITVSGALSLDVRSRWTSGTSSTLCVSVFSASLVDIRFTFYTPAALFTLGIFKTCALFDDKMVFSALFTRLTNCVFSGGATGFHKFISPANRA